MVLNLRFNSAPLKLKKSNNPYEEFSKKFPFIHEAVGTIDLKTFNKRYQEFELVSTY